MKKSLIAVFVLLCAAFAYCTEWSYSVRCLEGYDSEFFGFTETTMPEAWNYSYRQRSASDEFWMYNPYVLQIEASTGGQVKFFKNDYDPSLAAGYMEIINSSKNFDNILYRSDNASQLFSNTSNFETGTTRMERIHNFLATVNSVKTDFYGFDRYDFTFDGRPCILVLPKDAAQSSPWFWRARFFGHEPQTDIAMLGNGFVLAYIDVADMYGSPKAVKHWDNFYALLTGDLGLSKKCAIEAFSRGGLIAYNWAIKNADKVACIYADAPVCDIKSWPFGMGSGPGSEDDKTKCLAAYGFTIDDVVKFGHNPIDNLEPLAAADVPLLHICGTVDQVVPMAENTDILAERYRKLGGRVRVLPKPGVDHHPHSLENPAFIVDFLLANTLGTNDHITRRDDLGNCFAAFETNKKGTVAFLGGSITEMDGYRPKVCATLQKMFPQTDFEFINAGIASTCSTTGAFRLSRDVLDKGKIDLLFVEFAVNDNQDAAHTPDECVKGMEGVARHTLLENPLTDIVMLYSANESHIASYKGGQIPSEIAAHESVAKHYGLCSVNFASDVARRMANGEFDWDKFGGVHPADFGARIYADSIRSLLEGCKRLATKPAASAHKIPAVMDEYSYFNGSLVSVKKAATDSSWTIGIPNWQWIPGPTRKRFNNIDMLYGAREGASLELEFEGTAIGLFVVAGPDAGMVEYSIDGSAVKTADLYHHYSSVLHYPRTVMLEKELAAGAHKLWFKISDKKNPKSAGNAVRVMNFAVNGD